KIIFILCFFIYAILQSYSENLNTYSIRNEKHINVGKNEGEIGYAKFPGAPVQPFTFQINSNYKLYIPDPANQRLNIYDNNMNYLTKIKETDNGKLYWAEYLCIDSKNNILYLSSGFGLRKINDNGEEIFTIKYYKLNNEILGEHQLYLVENQLFYLNNDDYYEMLDESGNIVSSKNTISKINEININQKIETKDQSKLLNLSTLPSLVQTGKDLIIGNNFYSNSFRKHQEYYEKIKNIRSQILLSKSQNQSVTTDLKEPVDLNYDDYGLLFIGYDADHNSYWNAIQDRNYKNSKKQLIVVIDKYGILLDAFQYGETNTMNDPIQTVYPASGAKLAVAPTGDVWFMTASPKGYDFYKVERMW
ncbi:MAG: hypothetical protein JXR70_06955, partial [Spirochaetales bacterium]|nr:hypothetical protein [Spirochaetales bacterium]